MIDIKLNAPIAIGSQAFAIVRMQKLTKAGRFRKSMKEEDITLRPFIVSDIAISDGGTNSIGTTVNVFLSGPSADGSMQYMHDVPATDAFVSMKDAMAELDRRLSTLKEGEWSA